MRSVLVLLVLTLVCAQAQDDKAAFTKDGQLRFPARYREWVFLSSGLGMTYGPNAPAAGEPLRFDNVFVNPSSYREFMRTGKWPDGTVMVLEVRNSQSQGSINQHGSFQTDINGLEAHVKDSKHFTSGWAFFGLNAAQPTSKVIPPGNRCEQCHNTHGAVDTTFVQFYPDLIPIAKRFGTWRPAAMESK